MLVEVKPKKMSVYLANGKKTCAQVRKETGCDICINGTFYNTSTMKPVCDVRVDGVTLADSQSTYWGYGWNKDDCRAVMSNNMYQWYNYISCVAIVKDGKIADIQYNSDVGGKRGRTAIGYKADGTMVIYCYKDGTSGACTPEQLAKKMLGYGCVDALCLDGGGSVQINCDQGVITSSRKVQNFICIWEDKNVIADQVETCPYAEPKVNIRNGSRGTGAKWVQWMLNKANNAGLIVDGIFGKNSVAALKAFQSKENIAVDGICGPSTRAKLKG